ncbi:hypothetical protein Tco_0588634 [Tanacetum coccineum]
MCSQKQSKRVQSQAWVVLTALITCRTLKNTEKYELNGQTLQDCLAKPKADQKTPERAFHSQKVASPPHHPPHAGYGLVGGPYGALNAACAGQAVHRFSATHNTSDTNNIEDMVPVVARGVISAALAIAKRALHVISTLLHQNPRKDKAPIVGGKECFVLVPPMIPSTNLTRPWPGSNGHGTLPSWMSEYATEPPRFGHDDFNGFNNCSPGVTPGQDLPMDFSRKILCCSAKIRVMIGTTGSSVRQLQQETRTNKHVGDVSVESDERVICVDDSNDEGMDIIAKESGVTRFVVKMQRKLSRKERRKSSEIGRENQHGSLVVE